MKIEQLWIYPVKSMQGISLSTVPLSSAGFALDREWMVVDLQGRFLSQRELPRLATMKTEILDGSLIIRSAEGRELRCHAVAHNKTMTRVSVWDEECSALDEGSEAQDFLTQTCGQSLRLVRMLSEPDRRLASKFHIDEPPMHFGDSQPIHVCNLQSLRDLNSRLETEIGIDRFRPNIVVDAPQAFEEDEWRRLMIASKEFSVTKTTGRCVMTTINQRSGEAGKEPLRTLSEYRTINNRVVFGIYVVARQVGGALSIGDEIEVVERSTSTT